MRAGTSWRRGAAILVALTVLAMLPHQGDGPIVSAADAPRTLSFGAFPRPLGGQTDQQATTQLETQIGRTLDTVRVFETWDQTFPDSFHDWLRDGGRTIMVSVKPTRANGTKITWDSLATAPPGSQLDNEMRSWARRIRDFGVPIYVTLHHEPEAGANIDHGTATTYIAAWRRWVDIFRDEGATNARYMWITTDYGHAVPTTDRRYAPDWYPGDAWVDSMAIDAYNWHVCRPNQDNLWKTLAQIIEPFRQFGTLHPTKPLWLTEWASWEDPNVPGAKAQWIDEARVLFQQPAYSQFVGIAYFNSNAINPLFVDCNWRVDTSASSLASFAAMANDPFWSGNAAGGGEPPEPVAPTAAFVWSCVELQCTFTSQSTDEDGTVAVTAWNFGDDTNGEGNPASRTYATGGTYTVTLTVTDDDGLTASTDQEVTIQELPVPTTTTTTTSLTFIGPETPATADSPAQRMQLPVAQEP